jgi:hypothetical protein
MEYTTLHKSQSGMACEFFVAGELTRRGFIVTLTLGNTKAIDLLIHKDNRIIKVQVKGIQRKASLVWNISKAAIDPEMMYVLTNLNADTLNHPEFFVLWGHELEPHIKSVKSGRDYVGYNYLKRLDFEGMWMKI